jgi:hypothetical protein
VSPVVPGFAAQIAFGADGLPVIAYSHVDDRLVHVLTCADRTCSEIASDIAIDGTFQSQFFLQVDGGLPVIAHTEFDPELSELTVRVVRCLDGQCAAVEPSPAVPMGDARPVAMVIDPLGRPVVLLIGEREYQLSMLQCSDPTCTSVERPVLVGPRQGPNPSLGFEIPADGRPVVAYGRAAGDEQPATVSVARCDDATCATGVVHLIEETMNLWTVDLTFDGELPVVAYYSPPGDLGVIRCSDPACATEAMDGTSWDQGATPPEPQALGPVLEGWSALEVDGLPGPGGGGLLDVATNGARVVAVGTSARSMGEAGSTDHGAVALVADATDPTAWDLTFVPANGLETLVAAGPGFVAGGYDCGEAPLEEAPPCRPALWASADGVAWTEVAQDAFSPSTECDIEYCDARITDLAVSNGVVVALGRDGVGLGLWRSDDAVAFERVDVAEVVGPTGWIDRVTATDTGFLAFGGLGEDVFDENGEWITWLAEPLVLQSADGTTWNPVTPPLAEAATTIFGSVSPWRGGVIAAGDQCDENWECSAFLLHATADGEWAVLEPAPIAGYGFTFGLGDLVLHAGGHFDEESGIEQGVFATSTDGLTWSVFTADPVVFGEHAGLNAAVRLADGTIVAAGGPGSPTSPYSGIYLWEPGT